MGLEGECSDNDEVDQTTEELLIPSPPFAVACSSSTRPEPTDPPRPKPENEQLFQRADELLCAAREGDVDKIRDLFAHVGTVLINVKDKNGRTPLMEAARCNHVEAVRLLKNLGVDLNDVNAIGMTALMDAAAAGHDDVLEVLLDRDAQVLERSDNRCKSRKRKRTHDMFMSGLEWRISRRAVDVNKGDRCQRTALHYASSHGFPSSCRLLLEAGADLTAPDVHGRTAASLACSYGHADVFALLREFGSKVPVSGLRHPEKDLCVINEGRQPIYFRIKRIRPLSRLIDAYCLRQAEINKEHPLGQVDFWFAGVRMLPFHSVEMLQTGEESDIYVTAPGEEPPAPHPAAAASSSL
eukprot:tig00021037_g17412.t1